MALKSFNKKTTKKKNMIILQKMELTFLAVDSLVEFSINDDGGRWQTVHDLSVCFLKLQLVLLK
jgi:hypothetical protein